jgi:hypothetical protein
VTSRNYFILVVADVDRSRLSEPSAYTVGVHRLKLCKWGLRTRTRNRLTFKPGDHVVIYAAGKRQHGMAFIGEAEVASSCKPLSRDRRPGIDSPTAHSYILSEWYVELRNCVVYDAPVSIRNLKTRLTFIKRPDSPKWGACLQNGSLAISKQDFRRITSVRTRG